MLGIVWYVADPETYRYMPGDTSVRLFTIPVVITLCYIVHFLFRFVTRYFTNKKIKTSVEYAIVLFVTIVTVALGSLFLTFFINQQNFSWTDMIRTCGLITPIIFLSYLFRRNIRMKAEYNRQTLQLEKTKSNQLETELKYLRAQYHPHFLFNALNTIYFQIDNQNENAKNTVELLSELLRYQLYDIEEKVDISKEINFTKSYIQFQQLRMTERLVMHASFDDALDKQKIYPLIYQPFLENAFKYVGGEYLINLERKLCDGKIVFILENSLPVQSTSTKKPTAGIGIENIKRRLSLLYPDRHRLSMKQEEKSFIVELIINPNYDEN